MIHYRSRHRDPGHAHGRFTAVEHCAAGRRNHQPSLIEPDFLLIVLSCVRSGTAIKSEPKARLSMGKITKQRTGPDLALIKEFAEPWDRQRPPVFAGRKEEVGLVEANCRRIFDLSRNGAKTGGGLVVFSGAPGAGKSSLLEHLQEHWKPGACDDSQMPVPLTLDLELETLANSAATALAIVKLAVPKKEEESRERDVTNASFSAGLPGVALGQITATKEISPSGISMANLKEILPSKNWQRPLCLLVDEIQEVTKEHGNTFQTLHQGKHGLPIITVVAGLGDSSEKLREAGMSRLTGENLRVLGPLPPDEVHACVQEMFERCRVVRDSGQLEDLAADIAERTEGWPQHVRTDTAALFAGLEQTKGILKDVDWKAYRRQADAFREKSYSLRQSEKIVESCELVADLLQEVPPGGMSRDRAIDIIREKEAPDGPERRRLPPGMKAGGFLKHLIHQGVFQSDNDGWPTYPIPSFRAWLIDRPRRIDERNQEKETSGQTLPAVRRIFEAGKKNRKERPRTERDSGSER